MNQRLTIVLLAVAGILVAAPPPISAQTVATEAEFVDRWIAALHSIGVDPGTLVDSGSATPA